MDTEPLIVIEPEDCEFYQTEEGKLLIGRSDKFASMGFFDLDPNALTQRISRPLDGFFKQMAGTSVIRISENRILKTEKELKTGDFIIIPQNAEFEIKNPNPGRCVVFWRYEGDVSGIFEKLKKELPHIPFPAREKSGYKELFAEHEKRAQEKQGDR